MADVLLFLICHVWLPLGLLAFGLSFGIIWYGRKHIKVSFTNYVLTFFVNIFFATSLYCSFLHLHPRWIA